MAPSRAAAARRVQDLHAHDRRDPSRPRRTSCCSSEARSLASDETRQHADVSATNAASLRSSSSASTRVGG
jgi:hypothetical protein